MRMRLWGGAMCGLLAAAASGGMACGGTSAPQEADSASDAKAPVANGGGPACARTHERAVPLALSNARQSGTIALARFPGEKNTLAYIADEDDNVVRTVDVDSNRELTVTPMAGSPSQLLVLKDGRVAVTLRDQNQVKVLEPTGEAGHFQIRCSVDVATEPVALAESPDASEVVVTSAWAQKLTGFNSTTFTKAYEIPLAREPRAVIVDDDGKRAFVAHVVGAKLSVIDLPGNTKAEAASVVEKPRELDLKVRRPDGHFNAHKMREGCQGYALAKAVGVPKNGGEIEEKTFETPKPSPNPNPAKKVDPMPAGRVFAPMVTVDPGENTQRSSGYGNPQDTMGVEHPMVSVIDTEAERTLTRFAMDDGMKHVDECLLPRAASVHPTDGTLFVTCLGSDTVVELDSRGLDPMRLELRRWYVPAGPTGIAIDDANARAVIWSQFDHGVSTISLKSGGEYAEPTTTLVSRGHNPQITAEFEQGRELFHRTDDERISGDGRACASCHPDGREDALTWSTPEGGRQTIMLAGRLQASKPFGWYGAHKDLEEHITVTFQRLNGRGLKGTSDEMHALTSYLETMPSPKIATPVGDEAALVARGKELFYGGEKACSSCHLGGDSIDAIQHDVGSFVSADRHPEEKGDNDMSKKFDTPSLRFIGGTAPYFHDGRYKDLSELLAGEKDSMAHTYHFSRRDVEALRAFLETL